MTSAGNMMEHKKNQKLDEIEKHTTSGLVIDFIHEPITTTWKEQKSEDDAQTEQNFGINEKITTETKLDNNFNLTLQ